MKSIQLFLRVKNPEGLHAKPSALLSKAAQLFHSDIQIKADKQTANAKNIVELLELKAKYGTLLTVTITGTDCDIAVSVFKALFIFGMQQH